MPKPTPTPRAPETADSPHPIWDELSPRYAQIAHERDERDEEADDDA